MFSLQNTGYCVPQFDKINKQFKDQIWKKKSTNLYQNFF